MPKALETGFQLCYFLPKKLKQKDQEILQEFEADYFPNITLKIYYY